MTVLKKEILLHVSKEMDSAITRQRPRAAKHPTLEHELLVALKVPAWLYRILVELTDKTEVIFYGVPVVVNPNDEVEAVWWDPTMALDAGVPL